MRAVKRIQRGGVFSVLVLILLLGGCTRTFDQRAGIGLTVFCHGAGNIDFAHASVEQGLRAGGYQGQVYEYVWTISFIPLIDQVVKPWIDTRAERLARTIEEYQDRFPGRPVNMIGLSAGTGVVVWTLEKLRPGYRVDNVVLLSSSLSHEYNLNPALARVRGRIYNFYWPGDPLLGDIVRRGFLTVDGKFRGKSAGLEGFQVDPKYEKRVENIRWTPVEKNIANYGGHTDNTRADFIRDRVARRIMMVPSPQPESHDTATTTHAEAAPPAERYR